MRDYDWAEDESLIATLRDNIEFLEEQLDKARKRIRELEQPRHGMWWHGEWGVPQDVCEHGALSCPFCQGEIR